MKKIDEKIQKVYDFTVEYINENGFPPSVREISAKLNIKSTATVYSYIEKLKSKGLLEKSPLKKRALTITQNAKKFQTIPLIGLVTAGSPIFAVENLDGYLPLPDEFNNLADFALKVKGNSMINAGIFDKDIVIVKQQQTAEDGEIVVALIDDSATIKRFYKGNNQIILHPENDELQDIILEDVKIIGIVKGLMRKFN